jgi:hypothetical protein
MLGLRGEGLALGMLVAVIGSEVALLVVAWRFSVQKYRQPWSTLGFRRPGWIAIALVVPVLAAGMFFNVFYVVMVDITELDLLLPPPMPPLFAEGGAALILGIVLAVIVAPVAEEAFFRGFIFSGLRRRFGLIGSAALSALIFAVAHFQIGVLVPVFVLGLMLAWVYYRTSTIWSSILVHVAYNGLALNFALG